MLTQIQYEIISQTLEVLFLCALPVVAALTVSSLLVSALQTAMSVHEPAAGYAVRLVALVISLYYTLPAISRSLVTLAETAFK